MVNLTNLSTSNITGITAPLNGITSSADIDYIGYVFVPLLVIVGIVGNSLTVRVMASVSFRNLPVSKLLIAMSLSDMTTNLLLPFNQRFLRQLVGTDLRALSPAGCKLYFWAYRFARQTSSWMVVTISCERFVAVWLHVQAKRINTIRNAYVIIAIVYGIFAIYFGYLSYTTDRIINGVCISLPPPGMERMFEVFVACGLCLYYFAPSIILIVINSLITYKLVVLARKKRTQINVTSGTTVVHSSETCNTSVARSRSSLTSRTSFMLLCLTSSYVILVAPNAVLHLVSYIKKETVLQISACFLETAELMEQVNNSLNIVLYVLSNQRFRQELAKIVRRREVISRRTNTNLLANVSTAT